jgi:hypothetical protein
MFPVKKSKKKEMSWLQATFGPEVAGTDGSCIGEVVVATDAVLVVNVPEVIVLSELTDVEVTVEELAPGTTWEIGNKFPIGHLPSFPVQGLVTPALEGWILFNTRMQLSVRTFYDIGPRVVWRAHSVKRSREKILACTGSSNITTLIVAAALKGDCRCSTSVPRSILAIHIWPVWWVIRILRAIGTGSYSHSCGSKLDARASQHHYMGRWCSIRGIMGFHRCMHAWRLLVYTLGWRGGCIAGAAIRSAAISDRHDVFVQLMELKIKIRGSYYDASAQKRGDRGKENWERREHCSHEKHSPPPPKCSTSIIVSPWPSCGPWAAHLAGAQRILYRPRPRVRLLRP